MKSVKICLTDEKVIAPVRLIDQEGDGWGLIKAPESGVIIAIDDIEQSTGGVFISTVMLQNWLKKLGDRQEKGKRKGKKIIKDLRALVKKYRKK